MVTPPNSSNAPVPFGTPVHTRSSTTGYLGTKCPTRDKIFDVMSEEMATFFLGPMPPRQFLSTFLPSSHPSSFQPGMFDALTQPSTETAKYQVFVSNCVPLRSLSGLKRSPRLILFNHTSRHCLLSIHHTLQTRPRPATMFPLRLIAPFTTKRIEASHTLIPPSATSISNSKTKRRKTPS